MRFWQNKNQIQIEERDNGIIAVADSGLSPRNPGGGHCVKLKGFFFLFFPKLVLEITVRPVSH